MKSLFTDFKCRFFSSKIIRRPVHCLISSKVFTKLYTNCYSPIPFIKLQSFIDLQKLTYDEESGRSEWVRYAQMWISGVPDQYASRLEVLWYISFDSLYTTQKKLRISCAYFFVLPTSNSCRLRKALLIKA